MITIKKDLEVCKCGHIKADHNSWGTKCYRVAYRKERRRDKDGKYKVYNTCYQCICTGFKDAADEAQEVKRDDESTSVFS